MGEHLLFGLVFVVLFGVGAQWLAWRTQLPAILLLLLAGIFVGPVTGLLNPDALMGDMLAEKALENGWEGIVIHGAIRDAGTLSELSLGIKALAACPIRSEKRGEGVVDVPVTFAGVTIYPGDYIYSDLNGVLVSREPLSHPQL